MRLFEILILLGLTLALTAPLWPPRYRRRAALGASLAAVIFTLTHLIVEHYRWQMVPAYVLTAILFLLALRNRSRPLADQPRRAWRLLGGMILQLAVLLLCAAPPILFPVPRLPVPGGPYQIGTVSYDLTDTSRIDIYASAPNTPRELMIQIWYPATPASNAKTSPWMSRLDVAGPAIAKFLRLPPFILDHANLIVTNSYPEAPLADAVTRYPIVIYSHGWNGFRTINTNQMEALASHGFIAVAVDHTYGAMVTVFSDGRVALNNPAALPEDAPADVYQRASETLEGVYAADLQFVMDTLARLDVGEIDTRFAGRLDLERIGLFGHSTGGGAVVLACNADPRCKAGLGMDAWVVPVPDTVITQGLTQPFLFMRSEVWASAKNQAKLETLYSAHLANASYRLTILGTKHYDFTMLPLLTPLAPALKLKGPLNGVRGMQIITDYLVAFFEHYLQGEAAPLLDGPSVAYPEVQFEKQIR
jgi:predicted dienelactone hydrolase